MQNVADHDANKVGLGAVPGLDVVVKSSMEVLVVCDGEVELGSRASTHQQEGDDVSWKHVSKTDSYRCTNLR